MAAKSATTGSDYPQRRTAFPSVRRLLALLVLCALAAAARGEVRVRPTPDDGLQPRLARDGEGGVHLLYFKRRPDAREGDLYYRRYFPDRDAFGEPVRVSSEAYAASSHPIDRAAMAAGGDGRMHVVWYRPRRGEYLYSRSDPDRARFEPQRSMALRRGVFDAGADVAARGGEVALVWTAGDPARESERSVHARISRDGGAVFGEERMIGDPALGACACCSPAAEHLDGAGLTVAYRSAIDGLGRHMQLLEAAETGAGAYRPVGVLQRWEASSCPLSTGDFGADASGARWLVFETRHRIVQMSLDDLDGASEVAAPTSARARQKHPAVALNRRGERLVAWAEGGGFVGGGDLRLRLFDAAGGALELAAPTVRIGEFSFPAAAALPDGGFLVLY